MNKHAFFAALAATVALCHSSSARADELKPGVELGLRAGYGLPLGNSAKDVKLKDGVGGKIPFILDVGYRINPALYAGVFAQYAIATPGEKIKDACDKASCSLSVMRFGINAHYHLMTSGSVLPWLGAGIGYEISSSKTEVDVPLLGKLETEASARGFEFLNLQGGADFSLSPALRVGPFLNFSLAQYSSSTVKVSGEEKSEDIKDTAMHQWLTFGIRGAFTL